MPKYIIYLFVFVVGLLTLSSCPTVFVDEFWIGEGANNLAQTGKYAINSFRNSIVYNINAYPLYYLLQVVCIKLFSYSLFSIRLVSFMSMFLTTIFTVGFIKNITKKDVEWYWILCIFCNPLFWHSGHLARPEAITILVVSASVYVTSIDFNSYKYAALAGLISGLGIYAHIPGVYAVLVACSISFFMLLFTTKRWNWQPVVVGLGALCTLGIYFTLINTPNDLKTFLSGEVVVVANRKEGGLLKILMSYPLLYFKYIMRNLLIYLPIVASILVAVFVYKKEFIVKLYKYGFVLVTVFIVFVFFMLLGRPSRLYFINLEYWIIVLVIMLYVGGEKTHQLIKYTGFLTLAVWSIHIGLYTYFFPKSDYEATKSKILQIPNINQNTVCARIQYHGVFVENKKFLAWEDFKYLYDFTNRKDLNEYLVKNDVKYFVLDEETKNYKFYPVLEAFLSQNAKLIASIDNQTIASRAYDSMPFEWNYSKIFQSPQNYKIQVYSVVK